MTALSYFRECGVYSAPVVISVTIRQLASNLINSLVSATKPDDAERQLKVINDFIMYVLSFPTRVPFSEAKYCSIVLWRQYQYARGTRRYLCVNDSIETQGNSSMAKTSLIKEVQRLNRAVARSAPAAKNVVQK